jgi:hypothetical protein
LEASSAGSLPPPYPVTRRATSLRSLILIGKWLIYEREEQINESWYAIANSTLKGELGIDAKVSTAVQVGASKEYVVCVYTGGTIWILLT